MLNFDAGASTFQRGGGSVSEVYANARPLSATFYQHHNFVISEQYTLEYIM